MAAKCWACPSAGQGVCAEAVVEVNGLPFAVGFVEMEEFASSPDNADAVCAGIDFAYIVVAAAGHAPGCRDGGDGAVFVFKEEEGDVIDIEVEEFGLYAGFHVAHG